MGEVTRAAAVSRANARFRRRSVGQHGGDRALGVETGRTNDPTKVRFRTPEEVVDVPMADLVFTGCHPTVTLDSGEPAWTERAPGIRVPSSGKGTLTEAPERDLHGRTELDQQGVRPAFTHQWLNRRLRRPCRFRVPGGRGHEAGLKPLGLPRA